MRKALFVVPAAALIVMMVLSPVQAQPRNPAGPYNAPGYGPEWQQQGDWFCPYCGRYGGPGGYGMGPGMMGRGYGMGPGMMHRGWGGPGGYGMGPGMMHRGWGGPGGYGMGPGMMHPWGGRGGYGPRYGPGYQQQAEPLEKKEAKQLVEQYLTASRNPNLKVGDVTENEDGFEADIVTKDGSLVDKVFVDKDTGWMRSIY